MAAPSLVGGVLLLTFAYALLALGLFGNLVEYHYAVTPKKEWFKGYPSEAVFSQIVGMMGEKPVTVIPLQTRSLLSTPDGLVWWLLREAEAGRSGYFGPLAMLLFGTALPAAKLLILAYWAAQKGRSRRPLQIAGAITKWTAVDAVAEAVVVAMLLRADLPAKHCFGYAAYVGYCILSAVSVWLLDYGCYGDFGGGKLAKGGGCSSAGAGTTAGGRHARELSLWLPCLTLAIFVSLLFIGAWRLPLGNLHVERDGVLQDYIKDVVHKTIGPFSVMLMLVGETEQQIAKGFADRLPLPQSEASVFEAVQALLGSGHLYTIVGSLLVFCCVLVIPVVHAVWATILARRGDAKPSTSAWLHRLSELAMLDVFVIGIFIGFLVMTSVHQLLAGELKAGFWALVPTVAAGMIHQSLCSSMMYSPCHAEDAEAALAESRAHEA